MSLLNILLNEFTINLQLPLLLNCHREHGSRHERSLTCSFLIFSVRDEHVPSLKKIMLALCSKSQTKKTYKQFLGVVL